MAQPAADRTPADTPRAVPSPPGHPDAPASLPPPVPVLPEWHGRCLTNIVPSLLAHVRRDPRVEPPQWLLPAVGDAAQVVLLVLDGLGAEQLDARRDVAPLLAGATVTTITSVAPSTTACALTSLATGLPPAVHGTVGYRVAVGREVLNVLSWRLGGRDARRIVPARRFQPFPAFSVPGSVGASGPREAANGAVGAPVPVVSRYEYVATGFTASHLADAALHVWHTPAGLVVEVRRLLAGGAPFVYAYYDGVDRTAHARGFGEHYDAELKAVNRLVGDLLDAMPSGAALVVTADHGQVEVGGSVQVLGSNVMDGVRLLSGEGRFRWLHTRPGAAPDVAAAANEAFGHLAWVRLVEEVVDEGWLGGRPSPEVAGRLGDVALVPFAPTAFLDPADTGEQRLVCRHGSLTPDEMLVPLLGWPPGRHG